MSLCLKIDQEVAMEEVKKTRDIYIEKSKEKGKLNNGLIKHFWQCSESCSFKTF